jgi:hypothetical protein
MLKTRSEIMWYLVYTDMKIYILVCWDITPCNRVYVATDISKGRSTVKVGFLGNIGKAHWSER